MVALFRVIFVILGVFLLLVAFFSLVKKRMTEGFSLGWALGAVLIIVMGAVPGFSGWTQMLSPVHMLLMMIFAVFLLGFVFWISSKISQLMMKTQELAMHVSLLNQENEKIMMELSKLRKMVEKSERTDS